MAKAESNLFDLIYPSPVSLQELSSIAISLELWRSELNERRMNGTLNKGYRRQAISLKRIIPDIPTPIDEMIRKYTEILGESISFWLSKPVFYKICKNNDQRYGILKVFDDFVCDFSGEIHCTRTAKRMLLSDQFSEKEKFRIACYNCFENDIRLLWPSVSAEMENELHDDVEYEVRYWIYYMKNKMDELDRPELFRRGIDFGMDDEDPDSMEEMIFLNSWSSPECTAYFWNRLPATIRSSYIDHFSSNEPLLFDRFYLHKLNEHDLNTTVADTIPFYTITFYLSKKITVASKLLYAVAVFKYIKDKISEICFCKIILYFLKEEIRSLVGNSEDEKISHAYCEIWNNAPQNLKSSAVKKIFSSRGLSIERNNSDPDQHRVVIFLKLFLLNATFEQRSKFWQKNWFNLITTTRSEDCYEIMKLCFRNEADIAQFTENIMANCGNLRRNWVTLMNAGNFKSLDNILMHWFPEVQRRRELKQHLLQLFFFGNDSVQWDVLFETTEHFDLFIYEAYCNTEIDYFKKEVISSPPERYRILKFPKVLLSDATFEQKKIFWDKHWFNLITTKSSEDSLKIMKLCFSSDAGAAQFREYTMANIENIHQYCMKFLNVGNFKVLDIFLEFWFPRVEYRSELKSSLLHVFFFRNDSIPWDVLFDAVEQFALFVNDTHCSTTFVEAFKKNAIRLPGLSDALLESVHQYKFTPIMKFIKIFEIENESSQRAIDQLKSWFIVSLRTDMLGDYQFWRTERDGLNEILAWCLDSEDEVAEFKALFLSSEIRNLTRNLPPAHVDRLSEFLTGDPYILMKSDESGEESSRESEISTADQLGEEME